MTDTTAKPGHATTAIHGTRLRDAFGSPRMPLYSTTTFAFDTTAALLDTIEGRTPHGMLYTRFGNNPSILALEETLAGLEHAETALAFSAGMAALTALFVTHGRDGIVCIGEIYGGTFELLSRQLRLLGIHTQFLPQFDGKSFQQALAGGETGRKPGLVFFETPANPTLRLQNIALISEAAHASGCLVAVDSTFATPVNQRPLLLGADIVMHSATKYLGGHSDLTAGALMGSKALLDPIRAWRKNLGSNIAPDIADRLLRSLYTLELRVQRHNQNALAVAQAMASHAAVSAVHYPGLPDFIDHPLACTQMQGFGGIVALEVGHTAADAARVADKCKLFRLAPSLGGVESLITQPCTTTHHSLSPQERQALGIKDSLLRLSVGLEASEDLIADLQQALRDTPC